MAEMKCYSKCPKCGKEKPPLTLVLREPQKYILGVPETRSYILVCCSCDQVIDLLEIDNRIAALTSLYDEMDKCYGSSHSTTWIGRNLIVWREENESGG